MLAFQNTAERYTVGTLLHANVLDYADYQRWAVMKYKYFITVL